MRINSSGYKLAAHVVNQAAVGVATLAQRMTSQYLSYHASMYVARDPRAQMLAPGIESGQVVSLLKIPRRDGNTMTMSFDHFLALGRAPEVMDDFDKVWLTGALLNVDDALRSNGNGYFGHVPEAEIVRHLRNGVAHGNKFEFHSTVIDPTTGKLKRPANTSRYAARLSMPLYEVDTQLQGKKVLFDWGGPESVIDCLTVLSIHLWNMGHGIATP